MDLKGLRMKYKKTKAPGHPRADITGHVPTHILIAEQMLGRPLEKNELVHHCNFNKHDNDPSKLLVLTRHEHQQLPELQARFLFYKGLYKEFLEWYQDEKEVVRIEHEIEKEKRKLEKHRRKEHGHEKSN